MGKKFSRKKRTVQDQATAPKRAAGTEWKRGEPIDFGNEALREYYRMQHICDTDEELVAMFDMMQVPLAASFRLTCSGDLQHQTKEFYDTLQIFDQASDAGANGTGVIIDRPQRIAWYPDAYTLSNVPRKLIRQNPFMACLKKRLVLDFERGAIQRQELVSMIPPLLLDIQPTDAVIDMCAAPGSKTSEIIDLLHQRSRASDGDGTGDFEIPLEGAVLANDVDIDRARLLSHQLTKVSSPVCATICSDALAMPKGVDIETLYDKVLCDVPCSGDGTMRKNIDIWNKWSPRMGISLHNRQLGILTRGLQLLAPGGRLVYSTCSLNPLEDEAVVAAALKDFEEQNVYLLDCCEQLPHCDDIITRGLTSWVVPDVDSFRDFLPANKTRRGNEATSNETPEQSAPADKSQDDDAASLSPEPKRVRRVPRHFENFAEWQQQLEREGPTGPVAPEIVEDLAVTEGAATDQVRETNNRNTRVRVVRPPPIQSSMFCDQYSMAIREQLKRCARFMPQKLNSGGFFVAVFQRRTDSEPSVKRKKAVNGLEMERKAGAWATDDTKVVKPLRPDIVEQLVRFYGLGEWNIQMSRDQGVVADTMPLGFDPKQTTEPIVVKGKDLPSDMLYQKTDCERRIYLASPRLYHFYRYGRNLNFISFGSKCFERLDDRFCLVSACDYRLTLEGSLWLSTYMKRRKVFMTYSVMADMLDRDGLTRPYLLEQEEKGNLTHLNTCRNVNPESPHFMLLESGGAVAICEGTKGTMKVACLVTASGNLQPLMKSVLRQGLIEMLRG